MIRAAFAALAASIAIGSIGCGPATAGDYYSTGYRGYERSYQSSSCCYRRVVRYERVVRHYARPYYRRSYYASGYYGRYRYAGDNIVVTGYNRPSDYYESSCRMIRYRMYDGYGGWVWGSRSVCD